MGLEFPIRANALRVRTRHHDRLASSRPGTSTHAAPHSHAAPYTEHNTRTLPPIPSSPHNNNYYYYYYYYYYHDDDDYDDDYSCAIARAGLTMLSIIPYSSASCASKYLFLCRSYATLSYGCPVELAKIISM